MVAKTKTPSKVIAKKPVLKKKTTAIPKSKLIRLSADEILALIMKSLEDSKAEDIVTIPLAGKTSLADYMVIASGSSSRQINALSEKVVLDLKKAGIKPTVEGKTGGQWVIVDALDVIVHIFYPETRDFFAIEDIWNKPVAKQ